MIEAEAGAVANRAAVVETIEEQLSPATRKAYTGALSGVEVWFAERGWDFYPAGDPTAVQGVFVERVLSYLRAIADEGKTLSTVNKVLSAVKWKVSFEAPVFYGALCSRVVKAFMSGLARQNKDVEVKQAEAFTLTELEKVYRYLDAEGTVRALRDKALIAVGVASALRSSSLGELQLRDVLPAATMEGLLLKVRFSKTDQTGQGFLIPVAKFSKRLFCPVQALNDWLGVMRAYGFEKTASPKAHLFPVVRGGRGVRGLEGLAHPSITITDMLRQRVVQAGVRDSVEAAAVFSSHSLRATFITLSSQAGVSEGKIAAVSGHKDMNTLRGYDRSTVEQFAQTAYLTPKD